MMENLAIGIDIGATNTKIGLVDSTARIREHATISSQLDTVDPAPYLAAVNAVVEQYTNRYPVNGIGVALCSLVNAEHTGALWAVNAPALNHLNIQQAFATRFGCPVQVLNDVVAYTIAEYACGAGQGVKRLMCLALGTGIAIAAMINGRVIETWGGVSADAARIILEPGAEVRCKADIQGTAEALCGTAYIERLARARYPRRRVTAREVIAASRDGSDPVACQVMAEIGGHVGHLLALLSPIFFPQKILITGGTAEAGEPLFQAVREQYAHLIGAYMNSLAILENGAARPVEIWKAGLGPEAAIIGCAWRFLQPQA
jgi:glucokinase